MGFLKYLDYSFGVMGIIGMIIIVKIFMKFVSNHISHSTRASEQLSASINQIVRLVERKFGS